MKSKKDKHIIPTVGCIPDMNGRILTDGMKAFSGSGRIRCVCAPPAEIVEGMEKREIQAGIAPVACLLDHPDWEIVGGAAIGADGPILSVKLFSRVPLRQVQKLALDPNSRTSNLLARIILQREGAKLMKIIKTPKTSHPQTMDADAFVLIGDRCLDFSEEVPRDWYSADLTGAWKAHTDLPFVCACWIYAKAGMDDDELDETQVFVEDCVRETIRHGREHYTEIVEKCAAETGRSLTFCREYFSHINYNLGERELEGLKLFKQLATQLTRII